MSKADLHMHSTASDGGYSPSELLLKCKEAGLSIISLTDHDTTEGIKEATELGKTLGITVIPGVELSTKHRNKSVHMLGYQFDIDHPILQKELQAERQMRLERLYQMVARLNKVNVSITAEECLRHAKEGNVGRPHVAKVLVEKGYVQDVNEAFEKYLKTGRPGYVEKEKEWTPKEAIDLIHKAGGLAIVAHPVYYNLDEEIEKWIINDALDGVEVYHRDHDSDTVRHYEHLVAQWEKKANRHIYRTGGSDFHHETYGRNSEPLGKTTIPLPLAEKILQK